MSGHTKAALTLAQAMMQRVAFTVIVLGTATLLVAAVLAAFGAAPWLSLSARFGDTVYDNAGQIFQIGVTTLAVMLCFFLPSNARIMRLENSHRRFVINMEDIARAYTAAHAADRAGVFSLSSEFDAVRERFAHLTEHPDLNGLEPSMLEVAAQMSFVSRDLAETYSDEHVARARAFLTQRQQELEEFDARLQKAKLVCQELKHWEARVDLDESVARSQLARLRDDLRTILPEMDQPHPPLRVRTLDGVAKTAAE